MFNVYDKIKNEPDYFRQMRCGESLITLFNCPVENKYQDTWSHYNFFVYLVEGREVWHTAGGSYELKKGHCMFVRKGALITEQFFESVSCFMFFFIPDEFICQVLKTKVTPVSGKGKAFEPIMPIGDNPMVQSFFLSMMPYFDADRQPDQALLELKFRELILTLADGLSCADLSSYFCSLLHKPQAMTLQQVMEENYCFNLKLEEFARLSMRSLSGFKRDFQLIYQQAPGKWLLEKRLKHARHLLTNMSKTVCEAAYESGFENPSHFSRAFRLRFGTPPVAMRQLVAV